jgi:predicted  nucleic acid-binding Zn-ribbon protein
MVLRLTTNKWGAPMHERYQEICAAAGIGQISPEDVAQLHAHLQNCKKCRQAYSEFTNIASQLYAEGLDKHSVSPEEAGVLPDPDLLRQRFLQRADEVGILSNKPTPMNPSDRVDAFSGFWRQITNSSVAWSVAAMVVLALLPTAYEVGRRAAKAPLPAGVQSVSSSKDAIPADTSNPNRESGISALQIQIAHLKDELRAKDQRLEGLSERLKSSSENNENLLKTRAELESSMSDLQQKLRETQGLLQASVDEKAALPEKVNELKNALNDVQTSYVADEIKIRELKEQFAERTSSAERNAQLLERDRDIRDLMTARNLHIYDVFDTDVKGKTKPVFGRIFYTEGKSLIFYAYDLNEAKVANANYHYRVWGSQEAQKDKVTSLGVFYSDDKNQRRWVFKCNNPKILGQIDSVFVTLEPSESDSLKPKGQKLLDAYLGGVANHP